MQTSKLWNTQHHPNDVEKSLDECLAELELDYLDVCLIFTSFVWKPVKLIKQLYLIHWPVSFKPGSELFPLASENDVAIDNSISLAETWKAMIKLPKSKTRAIGVSNFTIDHVCHQSHG